MPEVPSSETADTMVHQITVTILDKMKDSGYFSYIPSENFYGERHQRKDIYPFIRLTKLRGDESLAPFGGLQFNLLTFSLEFYPRTYKKPSKMADEVTSKEQLEYFIQKFYDLIQENVKNRWDLDFVNRAVVGTPTDEVREEPTSEGVLKIAEITFDIETVGRP